MKKNKLLILILIMVLAFSFALVACNDADDTPENPDVEDEEIDDVPVYPPVPEIVLWGDWELVTQPTWTTDGLIKRKSDKGAEDILKIPALGSVLYTKELKTSATCTQDGLDTFTISIMGQEIKFDVVTKAIGHDWADTTYAWSEDGKSCTATRVCKRDKAHVETAKATISSVVEIEPTCMAKGTTKYTATFKEEWAKSDKPITKSVVDIAIDPNAHTWNDTTYVLSPDGKSCTATRVCKLNKSHAETVNATSIVSTLGSAPTYSSLGKVVYKVTFAEDWAGKTTIERADLPKLGAEGYTLRATKRESTAYVMGVATYTYTLQNGTTLTFDSEKEVRDLKYFGKTSYKNSVKNAVLYVGNIIPEALDSVQIVDIKGYNALVASYAGQIENNEYNEAFGAIMSDMDKKGIDVQFSVVKEDRHSGKVLLKPMLFDGLICSNDVDAVLSAFKADPTLAVLQFIRVNDDFIIMNDEDNTYIGYDVIEQSKILENGLKVSKDGKVLIVAPDVDGASVDVTIPDGVEMVVAYAFSDLTNYNVTLPDSVKYLSEYAFNQVNSVTIKTTSSLEEIGVSALAKLTLTCDIGRLAHLKKIAEQAFSGATIDNVILDDTVEIGARAFAHTNINVFNSSAYTGANISTIVDLANIKHFVGSSITLDKVNRNTLETAVITAGESLASGYFASSASLTDVVLADTITTIGANAFAGNTNIYLEAKNIPSGFDASWKTGTNKVYILSESTPEIDPIAGIDGYWHYVNGAPAVWEYTAKYTVSAVKGGYKLDLYLGTDTVVTLPSEYMGEPITELGSNVFDSVRETLTSVTFATSYKRIHIAALEGCAELTEVNLNEGLEQIENSVFRFTPKLARLHIPASVKKLSCWEQFIGEKEPDVSLTVTVAPENEYYTSRNGDKECNAVMYKHDSVMDMSSDGMIMEYRKGDILFVGNGATFPIGAKSIKAYAVNIKKDAVLVIPESVTCIESNAIGSIYIESIVWESTEPCVIEESSIICNGLTSITLPEGLTSIATRGLYMPEITSIVIPENVTEIGSKFVDGSTNLSKIYVKQSTLPTTFAPNWNNNGTSNVDVYLYSESDKVEGYDETVAGYWHYVDSVPTVWETVFDIERVLGASLIYSLNGVHTNATEVVVPDTFNETPITEVTAGAFANAPNIKKLTLGANIESVEPGAMSTLALTDIKIANKDITLADDALAGSAGTIVNYYGPANVYNHMHANGMKKNAESTLQHLTVYRNDNTMYDVSVFDVDSLTDITCLDGIFCLSVYNLANLTELNVATICAGSRYEFLSNCPLLRTTNVGANVQMQTLVNDFWLSTSGNVARNTIVGNITTNSEYDYFVSNGEAFITRYKGASTEVVVPTSIDGYPINVEYGYGAYMASDTITKLTMSDGMGVVPNNVGHSMTALKTVDFNKTKVINKYAFMNSSIETVDLGIVETIEYAAFYGCSSLVSANFRDVVTIGESAFNSSGLTSVVLGDATTNIGSTAFALCTNLKSIKLPNTMDSIGERAFDDTALDVIILPETIGSIGDKAFQSLTQGEAKLFVLMPSTMTTMPNANIFNKTTLENLHFRAGVDSNIATVFDGVAGLGLYREKVEGENVIDSVFDGTWERTADGNIVYNTVDLYKVVVDNEFDVPGYKISGYVPQDKSASLDLVFPTTYNGKPIKNTTADAMNGLKVNSVVINIVAVGRGLFLDHSELTSVTFGDKVINIGEKAFRGCLGLTSLDIPSTLEYISAEAFMSCPLTTLTFAENVAHNSARVIQVSAFNGAEITELRIGNGSTIKPYAFQNCSNLETITITCENSIYIEADAFANCYNLRTINAPADILGSPISINEFNVTGGTMEYDAGSSGIRISKLNISDQVQLTEGAFRFIRVRPNTINYSPTQTGYSRDSAGNIIFTEGERKVLVYGVGVVPEGITEIGTGAYAGFQGDTIDFASTVTIIQACAFTDSAITNITIPHRVTYVGRHVFAGCKQLTSVTVLRSEDATAVWDSGWYAPQMELTDVVFDASTVSKDEQYMYEILLDTGGNNTNNVCLTRYLGNEENITIPTTIDGYNVIKVYALFEKNATLTTLKMNGQIADIPDYFCDGCTSLTSVDLTGVVNIGNHTFTGCNIQELVLPETVATLGIWAFNFNTKLASITFNTTKLTEIPESAFGQNICKSIVIPEGVKTIGTGALANSVNDKTSMNPPSAGVIDLISLPSTLTYISPLALFSANVAKFEIAPGNKYYQAIDGGNGIKYINNQTQTEIYDKRFNLVQKKNGLVFANNKLTPDRLPSLGITNICSMAYQMSEMSEIVIPSSITEICSFAFYNCYYVTNVVVPEGVRTIGEGTFSVVGLFKPCTVSLPSTITSMGHNVFDSDEMVMNINMPNPGKDKVPAGWASDWNSGRNGTVTNITWKS